MRVRLARWQDGRLTPWAGDPDTPWSDWLAVAMSEVSVRQHWLGEPAPSQEPGLDAAIADALSKVYDQGRWSRLLPLRPLGENIWQAAARDDDGNPVRFHYSKTTGLIRTREK
jgi:hypothetical protein